jgi:hypothetical protein
MSYRLKCYDCINLINGIKDEPTLGGGCENIIHCAVRPVVEKAVRLELKHYGHNGNPHSSWLCGQTGIDENSLTGDIPIDDSPLRVYENDEGEEVAEFRDPAWISIDQFMAALPRMEIVNTLCRVRDHLGQEIRHPSGKRYKKRPVTSYIRTGRQNEWLLRREESVAEDVLWRAHKGTCSYFQRRPMEDDEVLQAHYTPEILEADLEDEHIDRESPGQTVH